MNKSTPAHRRPLVILIIFLIIVFFLCLCLYYRNPMRPSVRGNAVTTNATAKREVTIAFFPSAAAPESALNVMKAAAAQIASNVWASSATESGPDAAVTALYWKSGTPPDGPACAVSEVSAPDALEKALESARTGGNLTTAFRFARTLSEKSGNPDRTLILLTDRAPMDGEELEEGAYDSLDAASYRYANAAAQAAAEVSVRDSLTVVAFLQELSGQEFDFTRRFFNDIQTAGYYEILNASSVEAFCEQLAAETLKETGAQKLTFRYPNGTDRSAVCYYTDDYFSASAYTYNPSLATMSISFAMTAFASEDQSRYANKSINARNLLKEIGVAESAISTNEWFTLRPETDSIGVVSGHKPVTVNGETYTLIAVAMRGGGYGREWASNFTIGESGQHNGFDTAKNNVLDYLKGYIAEQKISGPVKFWVTGFSRAAATANLVSGELDKGYDFGADITYAPEDVYAYCFEPPAGALADDVRNQSVYYNIFNIVNQSDPVPFVAPSSLGFARYGIDRYLPSAQASSNYLTERAAMLRIYNAMDGAAPYDVDNFRMRRLNLKNLFSKEKSVVEEDLKNNYSQGVYLSNYVTTLAKEYIKDRQNYVTRYQDEIREVCSILYGCSDAQQKALSDALTAQISANWPKAVTAYFNPLATDEEVYSIVSDWLAAAVKEANVTDYDEETVRSAGAALSDLLVNLLIQHPNEAATLAQNLHGIAEAHYWDLCFAWMASMDENYKRGAEVSFNQGNYRIVRVNCDVDVSVKDDSGKVVAQIVNENPQDIRGSSIISAINENGEKIVILPVDSAYRVAVTRREEPEAAGLMGAEGGQSGTVSGSANGTTETPSGNANGANGTTASANGAGETAQSVNIGIDEYSAQTADITRGVDYLDIPLEPGETLESVIPAVKEEEIPVGSKTAYRMTAADGSNVDSVSNLAGEAAASAAYMVTADPSDVRFGMVLGGGAFRYGDFAQLEATPHDGYAFAGWRDAQNTLVSAENPYRLPVTENVSLTAVFEEVTQSAASVKTNPFTDVSEKSYCYDAVMWASGAGVAGGTTDTTFGPKEPCTAAQAITFLWRAAGSPEPSSAQSPFDDLDPEAYYYKAVLWAAEHDITMGTTEKTFSPDKTVSRSQFITLLYRTFGGAERVEENPFKDVPADSYYRDAVAWAYAAGVTRGTTATTFEPLRSCDRGQIVTFLYRYFVR